MPHPARPTVTLHNVAAAAGVSVATASRVLNGSARTVAAEYRERVLAAAAALRYTVDASAQAMRRTSDSIVLIADDLTTPSIGLMVAAMEREARRADAFVTVSSARGTPERQLETVRQLRALRPRAIVLTSSRFESDVLGGRLLSELLMYQDGGGRVVIVGETDMPFDSISFDDRGSGRALGAHLSATGHHRLVILAGLPERSNLQARVAGFMDGLRAGGVRPESIRVVPCEVSRKGGFEATRTLFADGLGDTDGLLAVNDTIAVGALSALRAEGVDVPSDLSVAGIDNIQLSVDVTPRLTTTALPLEQVGAEAIRLASRAVSPRAVRHLSMTGEVIVRDSTRPRP